MRYTLHKIDNDSAEAIWKAVSGDYWPKYDAAFGAFDEDLVPVGFGTVIKVKGEKTAFLSASGVFPKASGNHLQRRLIRQRIRWAAANGCTHVITYTTWDNYPSMLSLLGCGFRFYRPEWAWAGRDMHYYCLKVDT